MMRRIDATALALALSCACLAACTAAQQTSPEAAEPTAAAPSASATPAAHGAASEATAPIAESRGNEAGPAAARQLVVDYYAAINDRDHAKAYASWSDGGRASGQAFEDFRDGYANTVSVQATVGEPMGEEGAAGSRYIQVPVELVARQRDGSEKRYRGSFTLRAVMADGASTEQRRWHLASADLQRIAD